MAARESRTRATAREGQTRRLVGGEKHAAISVRPRSRAAARSRVTLAAVDAGSSVSSLDAVHSGNFGARDGLQTLV